MDLANKINLAIAIGTGAAAFFSYRAARISSSAAKQAKEIAVTTSQEEKNRWITGLLFSLANRCNECVTLTSGQVMPTEANVSKMITILCNAIDLVNRESPENSEHHLKNFWIFLHSSIWVELKKRDVLDSLKDVNSSARATLSSQYAKVSMELVGVVERKDKY